MPGNKTSEILALNNDASVLPPILHGPRQMGEMSKTAAKIMQTVFDSVATYGRPLLPEKITSSNKSKFEDLGLTVELGDMVYEIDGEYINATLVLTAPSTAFEHIYLDYRKKTHEDITRLGEYLAHNGTSGRKSYSKEHVTFNLVHGVDGDGHKALKAIEELDKKIHKYTLNLARVSKAVTKQEILQKAVNKLLQDTKDILSTALGKMKHEKLSHQHIVDEQTMHSAQNIRLLLRNKIKSANEKKKALLLENPINHDAIKIIESEILDIQKLFKLNDAQLIAARLYTGISFTHINAIGNKVVDALRDWTEEEFANNLLVAAVIQDTVNKHSEVYEDESFYRIESKYGGKEQEAIEAQAEIADFEAGLGGKEKLVDAIITKSGLTSTMRHDYAVGFLETDSTLTTIFQPIGLSISPLSYWQKENEVLAQPGQYVVIQVGKAEHNIDDNVFEEQVEFPDRHKHHHAIIKYAFVITSADDAKIKEDNDRILTLRVIKPEPTPGVSVGTTILRSYTMAKTIKDIGEDSIDSPLSTRSFTSTIDPLIQQDSTDDSLDHSESPTTPIRSPR